MSSSTTPAPTTRPWKTAILAGMASYLDAGAIVTTGIALVLYSATLGIDPGTLGLLSGLLTLFFAVGAIIGGRLGDRYGRKRVYSVTLILFAVGVGLLAGAVAVPMLFVGVILTGLAIGADLPVSLAMIAEEAPEGKKGKMIVFSGMLWLLGILVPILLSIGVAPLGELIIDGWAVDHEAVRDESFVVLRTPPGAQRPYLGDFQLAARVELCAGDEIRSSRGGAVRLRVPAAHAGSRSQEETMIYTRDR